MNKKTIVMKTSEGRVIKGNDPKVYQEELNKIVGKRVAVWTGESENRQLFDLAISVAGILDQHSDEVHRFRIVNENGTYVYFEPRNVVMMGFRPDKFNDNCEAIVKVSF